MIPPFDIFRIDTGGGLRWLEAAPNLEDAKARVRELAAGSPGEFVILSHITGNRILIKIDGGNQAEAG